jgi:hypothetical protein
MENKSLKPLAYLQDIINKFPNTLMLAFYTFTAFSFRTFYTCNTFASSN